MRKSFLFISCEEAHHICDKRQYGEATGWERVKLGLRLSWCRITRAYSNRNNKLTEVMQKADVDCLKNDERTKLQKQFEEELAKHQ
ncbi:hypothetical protein [Winogradskyella luteola]|uniref:Uncharacterized protein n=1 Tax=Winogradskyella luteola TaxID=2828330 RepID=A0A9X1FAS1_9FLAO|nr:hypothetical protein [Winogradskyella luteola]MBV7270284.1 hypothetical protein [Winogradskyella luteola]